MLRQSIRSQQSIIKGWYTNLSTFNRNFFRPNDCGSKWKYSICVCLLGQVNICRFSFWRIGDSLIIVSFQKKSLINMRGFFVRLSLILNCPRATTKVKDDRTMILCSGLNMCAISTQMLHTPFVTFLQLTPVKNSRKMDIRWPLLVWTHPRPLPNLKHSYRGSYQIGTMHVRKYN